MPMTGASSFTIGVAAGASIEVNFHHELFDAFPAQAMRAKVYSSSDSVGEWVAIQEVAGNPDVDVPPGIRSIQRRG